MQIAIANVLTTHEVAHARQVLAHAAFADGRRTAGWAAHDVKANEQALEDDSTAMLRDDIVARLQANALFCMAARPRRFVGTMFSRYREGHAYGPHVDNAIIAGSRTDVSFTLFLSGPEQYDGGELSIESPAGEETIKLDAGAVYVYPATAIHAVQPVTRGERLVMVGWVRSHIRDAASRELLFDLETAQRLMHKRDGKTPEFDLVSRSLTNLVRRWAD
jgi:PKHD-type hydroxylase